MKLNVQQLKSIALPESIVQALGPAPDAAIVSMHSDMAAIVNNLGPELPFNEEELREIANQYQGWTQLPLRPEIQSRLDGLSPVMPIVLRRRLEAMREDQDSGELWHPWQGQETRPTESSDGYQTEKET